MRNRTYGNVAVEADDGVFTVTLDGHLLTTPGRNVMRLENRKIADAIATEWEAQTDNIDPAKMPFTGFACTVIDRIVSRRGETVTQTVSYAATDLLCYRADFPDDLVRRQNEIWQPLVDWANDTFDIRLAVTRGVSPVDQPRATLKAMRHAVEAMDDFELAALTSITAACGSLVIALAVASGRLDAGEAFSISQLDEEFQSERWGEDDEAAVGKNMLAADIKAASEFLSLCRG